MSELNNKLISVLMINHNNSLYIEKAIRSILTQTYNNIELIILDDCSTDSSVSIIKKIAEQDKRVKLYINDKQLGIAISRNKVLEYSIGEFCAIMDSDDISHPQRLERQIEYMVDNNLDICGSWVKAFCRDKISNWKLPEENNEISKSLVVTMPFVNPSLMIRTKVLKELKYSLSAFPEDYDFVLRAYEKGYKMGNIPEYLFKYRLHDNQTIVTKSSIISVGVIDIRSRAANLLDIWDKELDKVRFLEVLNNRMLTVKKTIILIKYYFKIRNKYINLKWLLIFVYSCLKEKRKK